MLTIRHQPTDRDLRWFAGLLLPFVVVVMWGLWRRTGWTTLPVVLIALAALVAVIGLIRPQAIRRLYLGWVYAFFPLGWVVSHLILAATFYLVFTPLGLLLRLCGLDLIGRRWEPERKSYWTERPAAPPAESYFRQF